MKQPVEIYEMSLEYFISILCKEKTERKKILLEKQY